LSPIPNRTKAIDPAKQSARSAIDASRTNRFPSEILIASAAPAARVIAVVNATTWSNRVGPGRILTTAQIDRKIRHSAAKSQESIMKYTYSVEYWCLSILPLRPAEYNLIKKNGSVEILFCLYSFILRGSLENNPLSPPEGEAAQGEHPLDPLFFRDIFQPYQVLSQQGVCPSGGGGSMKRWSPQERLFVSMRISTEPKK
jgi:hypothetical protein